MRTFVHDAAVWGVACPRQPSRVVGVTMAGFRVRDLDAVRVVPHPAVTLLVEFGACSPVVGDAAGRQQRGSVVAGPGSGPEARSGRGVRTSSACRCAWPR
ncbi:hypothetical protein AB4305_23040 [Nocardia sp. 2YAB30]|uniref:hypothetical protein n=1 Tax=unclassified Nocardia TaxID=2637762 RepID=UPI003F949979